MGLFQKIVWGQFIEYKMCLFLTSFGSFAIFAFLSYPIPLYKFAFSSGVSLDNQSVIKLWTDIFVYIIFKVEAELFQMGIVMREKYSNVIPFTTIEA